MICLEFSYALFVLHQYYYVFSIIFMLNNINVFKSYIKYHDIISSHAVLKTI